VSAYCDLEIQTAIHLSDKDIVAKAKEAREKLLTIVELKNI